MADTEQLIVLLEARIDAFEKNMKRASKTADTSFKSIEDRAKRSAAQLEKSMQQATSGVVGAFKSNFLSAAGLSGLGVTALVASLAKINSELAKIPGLAREAGLSTDRLQEIKFAGAVKGVGDEDFIASLRSSMSLLDEAQRNVNSLSRLFAANGASIRDSNGELIKFDQFLENAARLMAGTKNEQEKIKIADMLGLSREWIAVLRNGPEEFRKSAASAKEAGAVLDADLLKKAKEFDREWNAAMVKFKAGFVSALADIAQSFEGFWDGLIESVPGASFLRDQLNKWAGGLAGMTIPELKDAVARSIAEGFKEEAARIQAEIDRRGATGGDGVLRLMVNPSSDSGSAGGQRHRHPA